VWGPGFVKKTACGTLNESTVVSALDLFPSIAHLAGATLPAGVSFDGEDLSRAFLGETKSKRTKSLFWNRPPDRPGEKKEIWPDLAVRENNWKLLVMRDGSNPQLFNLAKDPGEARNLAAKHPDLVRRLSQPLLTWWQLLPGSQSASNEKAGDYSQVPD
jgi:arylsulfatase A-like enzyme